MKILPEQDAKISEYYILFSAQTFLNSLVHFRYLFMLAESVINVANVCTKWLCANKGLQNLISTFFWKTFII